MKRKIVVICLSILLCFPLFGCNNQRSAEILLPAGWAGFQNMDSFDLSSLADNDGVLSVTENSDGSIKLIVTKAKLDEMLADTTSKIEEKFEELSSAPYIESITHSKDFSSVVVKVNNVEYKNTFFGITSLSIGMYSSMYQVLINKDTHIEIVFKDSNTNENIKTFVFPDDLA